MISKEPGFVDTTEEHPVGTCSKCGGDLTATLIDYEINRMGTCSKCGNVEPAQHRPTP
jgi:hypothetical protein